MFFHNEACDQDTMMNEDKSRINRDADIFRSSVVAGVTEAVIGGIQDYTVDRPKGMMGYVMHLTVAGQGIVRNNGLEFICRPGDILLFPPGVMHNYGRVHTCASWVHQWVYFHPRSYWKDMLNWEEICGQIGYYRPKVEMADMYSGLFLQIVNNGRTKIAHKQLMSLNLIENILLHRIDDNLLQKEVIWDERVSTICKYINDNLNNPSQLTIDKIALKVNLSRSRVLHLFREQVGLSIFQWRDDQRVIMAKRLLTETQFPISIIASKIGFEDPLYFSRFFKQHTGVNPTIYRRDSH